MRIGFFAFPFFVIPFSLCCQSGSLPGDAAAPFAEGSTVKNVPLAHTLDSLHLHSDDIWFHVDKSDRRFEVKHGGTVLKTYPCVLGEHPVGDKMMQGDRKTPEGTFTFRSKRRPHQWHVFIWIDYPNAASRKRFEARKKNGEVAANADIGGEVGIHGVPEGKDAWITQGSDWTWGCIALKNADVDEIYPYITAWKTKLVIEP